MNGMRKLLFILMVLPFTLNVRAEDPPSMLEKAVSNIKRWEGWHRGKMPYIGFGQADREPERGAGGFTFEMRP